MKHSLRALALLAALLPSWALAQTFPTVPDHTVIGRIGVGGSSGPSQAIPFANFLPNVVGPQSPNLIFAGPPSGGAAIPTFRLLLGADLPAPGASSLGGIQSKAVVANQFLNTISTAGVPGSVQPNCGNLSDSSVGCSAARGQLPGETSTGSASAGNVGEYIDTVVAIGSATSVTTATPKTIATLSLTAGDWDVSGTISWVTALNTSLTAAFTSLSLVTNTVDATVGRSSGGFFAAVVAGATTAVNVPIGPLHFSVSGPTSIFLVANQQFTVSTATAYGIIRARRPR